MSEVWRFCDEVARRWRYDPCFFGGQAVWVVDRGRPDYRVGSRYHIEQDWPQ